MGTWQKRGGDRVWVATKSASDRAVLDNNHMRLVKRSETYFIKVFFNLCFQHCSAERYGNLSPILVASPSLISSSEGSEQSSQNLSGGLLKINSSQLWLHIITTQRTLRMLIPWA